MFDSTAERIGKAKEDIFNCICKFNFSDILNIRYLINCIPQEEKVNPSLWYQLSLFGMLLFLNSIND